MTRRALKVLLATSLVVVATGAGYFVGVTGAPDKDDAAQARSAAEDTARRGAYARAFGSARRRGEEEGSTAGRRHGQAAGRRSGEGAGAAAAQAELASAAEAEAQAAREAAVAEAQERAANCGSPLFLPGYCPTDAEVAQENQAEALCGPGTAEGRAEAARLGIQC
jgi:hypothetical protein